MTQLLFKRKLSKPIAITSLVDVVFILLLFFMLTSSFNDWNAIHLKQATAGSATKSNSETQLLVLHDEGSFSLIGEKKRSIDSLASLIKNLNQSQPIILFPESRVNIQSLVTTLNTLAESGFQKVSVGKTLSSGRAS